MCEQRAECNILPAMALRRKLAAACDQRKEAKAEVAWRLGRYRMSKMRYAITHGSHTQVLISFATAPLAAQRKSSQQHQLCHKVSIVVVLC